MKTQAEADILQSGVSLEVPCRYCGAKATEPCTVRDRAGQRGPALDGFGRPLVHELRARAAVQRRAESAAAPAKPAWGTAPAGRRPGKKGRA